MQATHHALHGRSSPSPRWVGQEVRRLLSDAQAHAFRYGASNATDINQSNPFKLPGWLTPLGEHGHNEQK